MGVKDDERIPASRASCLWAGDLEGTPFTALCAVSSPRPVCPPGVRQCLETFVIVTLGEAGAVPLASCLGEARGAV